MRLTESDVRRPDRAMPRPAARTLQEAIQAVEDASLLVAPTLAQWRVACRASQRRADRMRRARQRRREAVDLLIGTFLITVAAWLLIVLAVAAAG